MKTLGVFVLMFALGFLPNFWFKQTLTWNVPANAPIEDFHGLPEGRYTTHTCCWYWLVFEVITSDSGSVVYFTTEHGNF